MDIFLYLADTLSLAYTIYREKKDIVELLELILRFIKVTSLVQPFIKVE
jgi:hypothetical protein